MTSRVSASRPCDPPELKNWNAVRLSEHVQIVGRGRFGVKWGEGGGGREAETGLLQVLDLNATIIRVITQLNRHRNSLQ
jgi:hypothetical protein